MKKLIIHTERIIPSEKYLKDWFIAMAENTDIPDSVLMELKEYGLATWETKLSKDIVSTTYKIVGVKR